MRLLDLKWLTPTLAVALSFACAIDTVPLPEGRDDVAETSGTDAAGADAGDIAPTTTDDEQARDDAVPSDFAEAVDFANTDLISISLATSRGWLVGRPGALPPLSCLRLQNPDKPDDITFGLVGSAGQIAARLFAEVGDTVVLESLPASQSQRDCATAFSLQDSADSMADPTNQTLALTIDAPPGLGETEAFERLAAGLDEVFDTPALATMEFELLIDDARGTATIIGNPGNRLAELELVATGGAELVAAGSNTGDVVTAVIATDGSFQVEVVATSSDAGEHMDEVLVFVVAASAPSFGSATYGFSPGL